MRHGEFGGLYLDDAHRLEGSEELKFRLKKRLRAKLQRQGLEPQQHHLTARNILILAVAFLLFSYACFAQSTFGSIIGAIQDPSGAVVPGALKM